MIPQSVDSHYLSVLHLPFCALLGDVELCRPYLCSVHCCLLCLLMGHWRLRKEKRQTCSPMGVPILPSVWGHFLTGIGTYSVGLCHCTTTTTKGSQIMWWLLTAYPDFLWTLVTPRILIAFVIYSWHCTICCFYLLS